MILQLARVKSGHSGGAWSGILVYSSDVTLSYVLRAPVANFKTRTRSQEQVSPCLNYTK